MTCVTARRSNRPPRLLLLLSSCAPVWPPEDSDGHPEIALRNSLSRHPKSQLFIIWSRNEMTHDDAVTVCVCCLHGVVVNPVGLCLALLTLRVFGRDTAV